MVKYALTLGYIRDVIESVWKNCSFLLCIIIIVLVYLFALNEMNEVPIISWWRHQMETFSALLALCAAWDCTPSPVDSPHKGQWRGALMFSFICAWINGWANNRMAGDSRRHRALCDATVKFTFLSSACFWQCNDLFVVYGRTSCKTMCGCFFLLLLFTYGPLDRYRKLWVAHAPGMPGAFPHHRGLAISTCITARAWRTCHEKCRDGQLAVSFEVPGGDNVPSLPDACARRNFKKLVPLEIKCSLAKFTSLVK